VRCKLVRPLMELKNNYNSSILIIDTYFEFFNEKFEQIEDEGLNEFDFFLLKTASRIRTNLNSIKLILNEYKTDSDGYLPSALILRTINSDCLTFLYLAHFIEIEKSEQKSCENEINIFNKEYVNFLYEFGVEELAYTEKYHPDWYSYISNLKETINTHYVSYQDYYSIVDGSYRLISNEEIRRTSDHEFFKEQQDLKQPFNFFSEKYKYTFLKKENEEMWAGQAFLAFKYFSQFHHISPFVLRWEESKKETLSTMMLNFTFEVIFYCSNLILITLMKSNYKFKKEFTEVFKKMEELLLL
jgi:hypothetical protein